MPSNLNMPHSFSVSVKVRLLKDLKKSIETCRQLEKCGVTFLTVHGRTPDQKSAGEVDTSALRDICDIVKIPIIANGGVKTLVDADDLYSSTHCDGVMAASGLLTNPALFSGANRTPQNCIKLWMDLKNQHSNRITFQCYHHHLVFMLDKVLSKQDKMTFNILNTFESVDKYLYENVLDSLDDSHIDVKCNLSDFVTCEFADEITLKHAKKCRGCTNSVYYCMCPKYNSEATDGSYFTAYIKDSDCSDYMDSNIFDEPI